MSSNIESTVSPVLSTIAESKEEPELQGFHPFGSPIINPTIFRACPEEVEDGRVQKHVEAGDASPDVHDHLSVLLGLQPGALQRSGEANSACGWLGDHSDHTLSGVCGTEHSSQ